jgi:outer membrane protein assembly factor BamB
MKITKPIFASTLLTLTGLLSASLLSTDLSAATMPALKGNETLWLVDQAHQLIKVKVAAPDKIVEQKPLSGLAKNETLLGIDYRVAYGVLYALSDKGQLYSIETSTGKVTATGPVLPVDTLKNGQFGFDFNPVADRIRVVNEYGQNLRLHPETAALASVDPELKYADNDSNFGKKPTVVAAAYTYNQQDSTLTTNYAIDKTSGTLVIQGSKEGTMPAVSPNTGLLFTVGSLGLPSLQQIAFDISDLSNLSFIAVTTTAEPASTLYQLDLQTGQNKKLGTLTDGRALLGMAIEP